MSCFHFNLDLKEMWLTVCAIDGKKLVFFCVDCMSYQKWNMGLGEGA